MRCNDIRHTSYVDIRHTSYVMLSSLTSAPKSSPRAQKEILPSHHSRDRRWKHSENSHLRKHNSPTRERSPNHSGTIATILHQASPHPQGQMGVSTGNGSTQSLLRPGRPCPIHEGGQRPKHRRRIGQSLFSAHKKCQRKVPQFVGDDTRPPEQTHQTVCPGQGTPRQTLNRG
jgi:hypothetical protein